MLGLGKGLFPPGTLPDYVRIYYDKLSSVFHEV